MISQISFAKICPVVGKTYANSSSLFLQKDRIDGMILMRPPTAWEERLARKDQLIEGAR